MSRTKKRISHRRALNKRQAAQSPGYERLEPKQMLTTIGSVDNPVQVDVPRTALTQVPDTSYRHEVVASYRADFRDTVLGRNDQWQFLWNAPENWSAHHPGNLRTGSIDDVDSYSGLLANGNTFRPSGANARNISSAHLSLNATGGHTGLHDGPATGNLHDRYAIASYTVDEAGFYSIADSFISKPLQGGDGIEVIVRVGNDAVSGSAGTAPGQQFFSDFDTNLGFLSAGETIYVAVGADGEHVQDRFEWDFSIYRFDGREISGFSEDFGGAGWQYFVNASRDGTPAALGDVSRYQGLVEESNGFQAGLSGSQSDLQFLRIDAEGGHTGPAGEIDRYAISAFTFEQSGFYAVTDSLLGKTGIDGDGLELVIHNDAGEILFSDVIQISEQGEFDIPIGFQGQGDTVYFAVGPEGTHNNDRFSLDFDIVQEPFSRAEPLRTLDTTTTFHVDDFGAIANDGLDDQAAIQLTIDSAIAYQQQTGEAVRVQLSPGTYRLEQLPQPGPVTTNLTIQFAHNLQFSGAGAERTELLVTNPRVGLARIMDSENVIVDGFSVDYETLPFTQGSVVRIVDDFTAILSIDSGYVAPNDSTLFAPGLTTHRTQFLRNGANGRLVNGSDFYSADLGTITRNSNGTYTVSYDTALPSSLEVGDDWYQIARINTLSNFGLARNTGHLSFIGIDSYASPSGFVQGQDNELVNVISTRVLPRDGRLVSHHGDMVHVQRSTAGPWVENNLFIGPSDDIAHVYRFIDTDLGAQLSPNRFRIIDGKDLFAGEELLFARDDGYRVSVEIVSIVGNVLTTSQPVEGYTPGTDVIPLDRTSRGSVIRDNVAGWHRAGRGSIVLFTPEATLLGNRFQAVNSYAVNAFGYEDYSISENLVIQGNSFTDIGFRDSLAPITYDTSSGNLNLTLADNEFLHTFSGANARANPYVEIENTGTNALVSSDDLSEPPADDPSTSNDALDAIFGNEDLLQALENFLVSEGLEDLLSDLLAQLT